MDAPFPTTRCCSMLPPLAVRPYEPEANERVIAVGGYGDSAQWHLFTDEKFEKQYTDAPCPHAIAKRGFYVVPRIVRAFNQGGYDSTSVCADCIAEAIKP